jgi:hypothetical protein
MIRVLTRSLRPRPVIIARQPLQTLSPNVDPFSGANPC